MEALTMRSMPAAGHAAPITCVALNGTASLALTGSYDGRVMLWDLTVPAEAEMLASSQHRRLVNAVSWNPVRRGVFASASADKTVAVWCWKRGESMALEGVTARHTDDVNSVSWFPDGERFVCVSEDGKASLWDSPSFSYLGLVTSHSAHCMMVDISVSGLGCNSGRG